MFLPQNNRFRLIFGLFIALWLASATADANPLDVYGFGPRAVGMGGGFTGLADDYSALYYNVAGLAWVDRPQFAVGMMVAHPTLGLNLEPAPGATQRQAHDLRALADRKIDVDDAVGFTIGLAYPFNDYLHFGVGVYLPQGLVIRLRPYDSHIPTFVMHENKSRRIVTLVGGSLEPISGFALGAGVELLADSHGVFTFPIHATNDNLSLDPDQPSAKPLDVDATLNLDFPLTATPFAGVMVRPLEWLRFGAAYRGSFQWNVRIGADIGIFVQNYRINLADLSNFAPGLLPIKTTLELYAPALGSRPLRVPVELGSLEGSIVVNAMVPVNVLIDVTDHWKPQEVAFGASANVGDAWTFTGDVTWYDWSAYPSPDMRISIDDLHVNLSTLPTTVRARIQALTIPVLGTIGPLPAASLALPGLQTSLVVKFKLKAPVRPETHDVFIPRVGVEYHFPTLRDVFWLGDMEFAARGGYSYEQSPFVPDSGYTNLVDLDAHVFSTGFGVQFNRSIGLDFYGQYKYLVPVRFEKQLVDPDMPFDAVAAEGNVLAGGMNVGFRW